MKIRTLIPIIPLASFCAAPLSAAVVITGVTVTATTEWTMATQGAAVNLVNNGGLYTSDDTTIEAAADDLTAVHNSTPDAADQWHGDTSDLTPTVTFNLSGSYDLAGIYIWNANQSGATNRGVNQFNILVSDNNGATYTPALSNQTLTQSPGDTFIGAQFFDLAGNVGITNVQIEVLSNYGGNVTGLSEVKFGAIPEPSTTILLGGLGLLSLFRRRC